MKIFLFSQCEVISKGNGSEILTARLFQTVAQQKLKMAQPLLAELRGDVDRGSLICDDLHMPLAAHWASDSSKVAGPGNAAHFTPLHADSNDHSGMPVALPSVPTSASGAKELSGPEKPSKRRKLVQKTSPSLVPSGSLMEISSKAVERKVSPYDALKTAGLIAPTGEVWTSPNRCMIAYFPPAYPDELFYSICSRFSELMNFPMISATKRQLGMSVWLSVGTALPHNLDALVSSLPPSYGYTSDRFIDQHTVLPFFAPFLSEEEFTRVRASMKNGSAEAIHESVGMIRRFLKASGTMSYCPGCVIDDRKAHEEAYWHRLHQISGVEVCPFHACLLERVDLRHQANDDVFVPAETCVTVFEPRPMDGRNPYQKLAKMIAIDIAWLLNQTDLPHRPDLIPRRFIQSPVRARLL